MPPDDADSTDADGADADGADAARQVLAAAASRALRNRVLWQRGQVEELSERSRQLREFAQAVRLRHRSDRSDRLGNCLSIWNQWLWPMQHAPPDDVLKVLARAVDPDELGLYGAATEQAARAPLDAWTDSDVGRQYPAIKRRYSAVERQWEAACAQVILLFVFSTRSAGSSTPRTR